MSSNGAGIYLCAHKQPYRACCSPDVLSYNWLRNSGNYVQIYLEDARLMDGVLEYCILIQVLPPGSIVGSLFSSPSPNGLKGCVR